MISAGRFSARATGAALGLTGTNKEQVGVAFELLDGPDAGQSITWYGYFTDATYERTIESLRIAGWTGDDLGDLSSIGGESAPVVQLVIEHEEYEGKTSAKVRWVNSANAGGVAMQSVLDASAAAAFAARMKSKIRAYDAKQTQGKPRGTTPTRPSAPRPASRPPPNGPPGNDPPPYGVDDKPPPGAEDDIPF